MKKQTCKLTNWTGSNTPSPLWGRGNPSNPVENTKTFVVPRFTVRTLNTKWENIKELKTLKTVLDFGCRLNQVDAAAAVTSIYLDCAQLLSSCVCDASIPPPCCSVVAPGNCLVVSHISAYSQLQTWRHSKETMISPIWRDKNTCMFCMSHWNWLSLHHLLWFEHHDFLLSSLVCGMAGCWHPSIQSSVYPWTSLFDINQVICTQTVALWVAEIQYLPHYVRQIFSVAMPPLPCSAVKGFGLLLLGVNTKFFEFHECCCRNEVSEVIYDDLE